MSLSSEAPRSRSRVLHGADVLATAADLSTVSARPARALVVNPQLIEDATPIIQKHLDRAKQIQAKVSSAP